ncbi:PSP1 domain-containing protein [Vagococcus sp.]|uniref:PSP1 domain-containing protein n=1 Tax=Vagococcus sp. TaxID=1933889 RepID=UPI003F992DF8
MVEVVGVRFKPAGRIYYYAPERQKEYGYNDKVIVESQKVKELAEVAIPSKVVLPEDLPDELQTILYTATEKHLKKELKNQEDAKVALKATHQLINKHKLAMKLVSVNYSFDRSKMIFCFTAENRIDFRELVKDLASIYKTRIELKQIGVRDEAKILGGIGPCGRPLCCSTFLGDFVPVSIKMAKEQSLSLNPSKISGLCGRLMCCLNYENDEYERIRKIMPDYGQRVMTPDGQGKVIGLNILDEIVKIKLVSRETPVEFDASEVSKVSVD